MDDSITTSEAAKIIGCVQSRVRQLLKDGKLAGKRLGRDWLVSRASAKAYGEVEHKPGPIPAAKKKVRKK